MAATGKKAQGFGRYDYKDWVIRHGHAPRRSPNTAEKAIETRVRQAGRREIRRELELPVG